MIVTYGEHTLDFSVLPPKSLEAMLKRGVSHFLGNEIASKVSTRKKKHAADNAGAELSADEAVALRNEFTTNALAALSAGTVGTASRGPAADPVDAEAERIAWSEVQLVLKSNNIKASGKGDERVWEFANGAKFSKDELIERRITNAEHKDRIFKDAEKNIKARAKKLSTAKVEGDALSAI